MNQRCWSIGWLARVDLLAAPEKRRSAIATSGDYRRALTHEGRRYAHTLDPLTGRPVAHGLASVTILAESAMVADAQATAVTVLGPDLGYEYASRNGLAALLVDHQQGRWRERMTPALARMMA